MVKVLVVDDHQGQLEYVTDTLKYSECGPFQLITASNGNEALAAYAANRDLGLVILDTDLAPSNEMGWQVYDKLREQGYTGPALARSGRDNRPE